MVSSLPDHVRNSRFDAVGWSRKALYHAATQAIRTNQGFLAMLPLASAPLAPEFGMASLGLLSLGVSEAQSKKERGANAGHVLGAQPGNHRTDSSGRHRLNVIEIDRAIPRQAVCLGERDLSWNVPDRGGDRGYGHLTQECEGGITGEDHHRASLVGLIKPVPADFAAFHDSPQACSVSHPENSPRLTGFRKYPSRCFLSCSRSCSCARACRRA